MRLSALGTYEVPFRITTGQAESFKPTYEVPKRGYLIGCLKQKKKGIFKESKVKQPMRLAREEPQRLPVFTPTGHPLFPASFHG